MSALPEGHWARAGFVVCDTETTGVDVETDLIASISTGLMDADAPAANEIVTDYVAVDMPEAASKVNHLTAAILAERATPGATTADTLEQHVSFLAGSALLGKPIVIANAPFDLTILDRECRRNDVLTLTARMHGKPLYVVDPIVLDKRAVKFRRRVSKDQGARQLKTLCQVHGVGWDDQLAHSSEYDAVMAGRVTWRLLMEFPVLSHFSLPELHRMQVGWYQEQAAGLRGWFRAEAAKRLDIALLAERQGDAAEAEQQHAEAIEWGDKAKSVTFDWPVRPLEHTATAVGNADHMRQVAAVLEQQDRGEVHP